MSFATLAKPKKAATVNATLAAIAEAVEKIKNDEMQYFPTAASIGDAVRQGDLYVQLIAEDDLKYLPHIYAPVSAADLPNHLQLAPGNTKGSRHVLQSADGLEMWLPVQTDAACLKHVYWAKGEKMPKDANRWSGPYRSELETLEEAMALAGPIMKLSKPNVVTHPEHGDWHLPTGVYRVIFQRTVDEQQRIRRVLD